MEKVVNNDLAYLCRVMEEEGPGREWDMDQIILHITSLIHTAKKVDIYKDCQIE